MPAVSSSGKRTMALQRSPSGLEVDASGSGIGDVDRRSLLCVACEMGIPVRGGRWITP